ncbi:MAG: hypothetical protein SFU84_03950 [Gemmatimonadales bacterium]|nr:hypothetical protein [Gemmatimonadales bacterium]
MNHPPLAAVRDAVLAVHRNLLETERLAWERMNGRVAGNLEVLRLAIEDPWFAWLRPLTALIAAMDEALQDDSPEADARVAPIIAETSALLRPDENGSDFQQRYDEFVQLAPDVAVAHGRLMRVLAG